MLVLITKVSDEKWYKIKEIENLVGIIKLINKYDKEIILRKNPFFKKIPTYWKIKPTEKELILKAPLNIIIFDSYDDLDKIWYN